MRTISTALAYLIATAAMPLKATTPSDFSHAWAIVTPTPNTAYSIELPDEVVLATQHNWADAGVLDAADKPMQLTLSQAAMNDVTPRSTLLKCALQSDTQSADATYRCTADPIVSGAYGMRIERFALWPASSPGELRVRNEKGDLLATIDGTVAAIPGAGAGIPVPFEHSQDISSLYFDVAVPGARIATVRVISPPSNNTGLRWHAARFLSTEQDGKRLYYSTGSSVRTIAVRFRFEQAPAASAHLTVVSCDKADCTAPDTNNVAYLDELELRSGQTSFPVVLGVFGSEKPFLRVDSSVPLTVASELEFGWATPTLTFIANGAQPYTLAVGQEVLARRTDRNPPPFGLFAGYSPAMATLEPYSERAHLRSRPIDLTMIGPMLLVLALAIGFAWALWPTDGIRPDK